MLYTPSLSLHFLYVARVEIGRLIAEYLLVLTVLFQHGRSLFRRYLLLAVVILSRSVHILDLLLSTFRYL